MQCSPVGIGRNPVTIGSIVGPGTWMVIVHVMYSTVTNGPSLRRRLLMGSVQYLPVQLIIIPVLGAATAAFTGSAGYVGGVRLDEM